jgi:hypothetical protein
VAGESERQRLYGKLTLAGGVIIALYHWLTTQAPSAALDDSNALGYSKRASRQMKMMMGHFGSVLAGWQEMLDQPIVQSIIILAIAGLFAAYFFRVAWVLENDDQR